MITMIQALPIGNALRVFLSLPDDAIRWRLLRRLDDAFTGPEDPGAVVVLDSDVEKVVLDRDGLANGTTYYYKLYALIAGIWTDSPHMAAAPEATLLDASTDPQELVRVRLQLALQAEINSGQLLHENNRIPVLTAPPVYEDTRWPVVSVHLQNDSRGESALGMLTAPDEFDDDDLEWAEFEGYLSAVNLMVVAWSLNPDERITLRKAIKRAILGNMPVFDAAGMLNVEVQFSDTEDFERYNAPVYQAVCQISCLAPSAVSADVDAIDDVTVTAEAVH